MRWRDGCVHYLKCEKPSTIYMCTKQIIMSYTFNVLHFICQVYISIKLKKFDGIKKSFAHVELGLLLSGRSSLFILNSGHFSSIQFANIFSHSVRCLFTLLTVSLDNYFLLFWWSLVFVLSFVVMSKKSSYLMSWRFLPMLSSNSFIFSALMFKPIIHFEIIYVYDVR